MKQLIQFIVSAAALLGSVVWLLVMRFQYLDTTWARVMVDNPWTTGAAYALLFGGLVLFYLPLGKTQKPLEK
jgi:uncharacterized membrane protein